MPVGELDAEQQPAAAHVDHAGDRAQRRRSDRRPCRSASAGASMRRISSITAHDRRRGDRRAAVGAAVIAGLEHGRDRRRGPSTRPTGKPLPIALASVTTSGTTPACWKPNHSAGAAEAGLDLVDHHQRARSRRTARGSPARYSAVAGWTPPSPCTGSIRMAATEPSTAAAHARRGRPTPRGGSPRASAGTARAWSAGRWRRASRACGRGSCRAR